MGNTPSSSSSSNTTTTANTNNIILQIPVEESLLAPPNQNNTISSGTASTSQNTYRNPNQYYSLRDVIDPIHETNNNNSNSNNNSSSSSSILKSKYGYTIDTGIRMVDHEGNSSTGTTGSNTVMQQQQHFFQCTSGRMMKTFPLRRTGPPSGGTTTSTTSINNSHHNNNGTGSTAVVKVTWLLEQHQVADPTSSSYRTTTWLEEHVQELQRIRTTCQDLSFCAPYVAWGYVQQLPSHYHHHPPPIPKPVLHNIMMAPHNQKYYIPAHYNQHSKSTATTTSVSSSTSSNNNGMNTGTVLPSPPASSSSSPFLQPQLPSGVSSTLPITTTVRAVYLLRSSVYTTLADRLCCRPFLTYIEKLYITHQLLVAVQTLHDRNIIHGSLTTENIGLTSTNYVILLDLSSPYKAKTALPDNDPSEYVYYFQSHSNHYRTSSTATTTTTSTSTSSNHSNRRCYLAPERFYSPSSSSTTVGKNANGDQDDGNRPTTTSSSRPPLATPTTTREPPLTPQMDIFSLGCVLTELFCNGERCFDLGDIMEYRRLNNNSSTSVLPNTIVQKLNKIDNSTIRAACKHMMQIHPSQRCRSVQEYYDRLFRHHDNTTNHQFPTVPFQIYTDLLQYMMIGTIEVNKLLQMIPSLDGVDAKTGDESIAAERSTRVTTNDNTGHITTITPDARILLLAMAYSNVLYETMGVRDQLQTKYLQMMIGPTLVRQALVPLSSTPTPITDVTTPSNEERKEESMIGSAAYTQKLFANVEELLNNLDLDSNSSINIDDESTMLNKISPTDESTKQMSLLVNPSMDPHQLVHDNDQDVIESFRIERTELCKSSLLIYVQVILSTIRHVQRPVTKIVALQLLHRLIYYVSDDIRLQRIVPVTVSLLQDSDPLVRAKAVQVITTTLSMITTFPPSDSKIFPQYIFKRVSHMITDPTIIVRVTFARCIATLAETAQRFLDVTHTVRLYELVGNETNSRSSGVTSRDEMQQPNLRGAETNEYDAATVTKAATIFGDEVTKLLDAESRASSGVSLVVEPYDGVAEPSYVSSAEGLSVPIAGKTLIVNTYSAELTSLQETISRWVVHIATDQSEHCSFPKRAIISDLSRLCAFFGMEGVMSYILPQILSFLNERKDWQLRASLFEQLPAVCQCIGRAATEEFVLPCIEIGLVDSEERVICCALMCLSRIAKVGLLSRTAVISNAEKLESKDDGNLIKKYGPLLLFPSESIRHHAIKAFMSICGWIGPPDCEVFIFPILRPYFLCRLESESWYSEEHFKKLLKPAWTRERVDKVLHEIKSSETDRSWTPGAWTSIGVTANDGRKEYAAAVDSEGPRNGLPQDPEECSMREYLKILSRHLTQSAIQDRSLSEKTSTGLAHGIEGYGKLAQSIMFAKQNAGHNKDTIPDWYVKLRDVVENSNCHVSESVSIQSVATLGQVYGLSIMGIEGIMSNDYNANDGGLDSVLNADKILHSFESLNLEGAYRGEWGCESVQHPEIIDTTLLVTKLKALRVPPLPLELGSTTPWPRYRGVSVKDLNASVEWKPRPRALLATSSTFNGHTAPISRLAVSADQAFLASASFDGTCRVWESQQISDCGGLLESSVTCSDHSRNGAVRINDIAMVEGTHSVVSGASDGSVNVWRVDMVNATGHVTQSSETVKHGVSRAVGSTSVRNVDIHEGEVLAVSHFNSPSASIVVFGTQQGVVHSWDLRCANEPFKLQYSPEFGYMTSMALGSDRNWIVSGTSRGYVALWDIRFQQCVKLWRHNRCSAIGRLATSTVPMPENWGVNVGTSSVRPFLFVAAGANECSMFDVLSSTCAQCFRTVAGDSRNLNEHVDDPPKLIDISFNSKGRSGIVKAKKVQGDSEYSPLFSSINCMVGSIGTNSSSYLITGGTDSFIRFWDFTTPSKCFVINGLNQTPARPTYERIDFDRNQHLMLCRQTQLQGLRDENKLPRKAFHGLTKPEQNHTDSILDLKLLDNNVIVSCSRDSTIKVWK